LISADTSEKQDVSALIYIDDKGSCVLELFIKPDLTETFSADDFFTSLCELREWLYKWKGYYPALIGALENVYPSRMSKQMSKGIKAYYLKFGKQAKERDLLDIFDKVKKREINKLATVKEQKEYYINWLNSL